MSVVLEDISEAALSLPVGDRATLADRLLDSLDSQNEQTPISDLWMAEIRRRVDEVKSGNAKLIDGAEGLRRVREALRK
ncbi:MAG: addiction module protein [Pyrinomonadaceae bacterium]|nr:addiction module protein [Chloracidobacterium sp.]